MVPGHPATADHGGVVLGIPEPACGYGAGVRVPGGVVVGVADCRCGAGAGGGFLGATDGGCWRPERLRRGWKRSSTTGLTTSEGVTTTKRAFHQVLVLWESLAFCRKALTQPQYPFVCSARWQQLRFGINEQSSHSTSASTTRPVAKSDQTPTT